MTPTNIPKQDLIDLINIEKYITHSFNETEDEILHEFYMSRGRDLADIILDFMGFPPDTTVEKGMEKGFCRDYLFWQISDLNINAELTYRGLLNQKKELDKNSNDSPN